MLNQREEWHVTVTVAAAAPLPEDLPFDIMEALGSYCAAVSMPQDMTGATVTLTVDSDSASNAILDAIEVVGAALAANHVQHEVKGVSALNDDDFEAELNAPAFPEVVGYAEIAELAGVTRQRARQFAEIMGFPKPVITTAQGPLMAKTAVQHWLRNRTTRRTYSG